MTTFTGAAAAPVRRRFDLVQLFFNGAGRLDRRSFVCAMVPVCATVRIAAGEEGFWSWLLGGLALVVACAVLSKRLHDVSLAGWWSAGPVGLTAAAANGEAPTTAAQAVALVVAAGGVLALALWPGMRRFNRFGPPPHERGERPPGLS